MGTRITIHFNGATMEYFTEMPLTEVIRSWETYENVLIQREGEYISIYKKHCPIVEFKEVK